MSRRSLLWRRKLAQAGGNLDKIIPRSSKGEGRMRRFDPVKGIKTDPKHTNKVCTWAMTQEKLNWLQERFG